MYDSVLEAHEKSKNLEKEFKELSKVLQNSNKEKETIEMQQTEAIMKHTQLELDVNDLGEKNSSNVRAKVDAVRQLDVLHTEIKDSTKELDKITPLYKAKAMEENNISRGLFLGLNSKFLRKLLFFFNARNVGSFFNPYGGDMHFSSRVC